ncbi:hypothetical protein ACOTJD_30965 [Achromobacter xylosoxidans]
MSKWVSVAVLSRIDILVELGDEEDLVLAQEIALDEVDSRGVHDIHECREVTGEELESARLHADEIVPLE